MSQQPLPPPTLQEIRRLLADLRNTVYAVAHAGQLASIREQVTYLIMRTDRLVAEQQSIDMSNIEDPAVQARLLAVHEQHMQDTRETEQFLDAMRDSD